MKPRPYQLRAVESCLHSWSELKKQSVLGVSATGTGKTVIFSMLAKKVFPLRTMVIAHRQELIWQAREKLQRVTGFRVDVEMGEHRATMDHEFFQPRATCVVSTVQTHVAGGDGGGRISKFNPDDFGLLVIDEAHHAPSSSYRRIVDWYMANKNIFILGVTATPDRADMQAMGNVFEHVAFKYEILDAIRDGWLVPIDQQFVSIESLDFSQVKTSAGDLNTADLDAVMQREKNLHGVASAMIDIIGTSGKRGIGFASSVNHARTLSEIFNRHRSGMSACVSAGTPTDERKQIITSFRDGSIQWIWNCGIFTEGFDDSGVEIIGMARPTKSRILYAQMAGRGGRPHESVATRLNELPDVAELRRGLIARSCKPSCLIVDFVGNSGRHKLMTSADILGGEYSESVREEAVNFATRTGGRVRMDKQLETSAKDEEERQKKIKEARELEAARKAKLVGKSTFKTQSVNPFDEGDKRPVAGGKDRGSSQLSAKQRAVLRNNGHDPDAITVGYAKHLLAKIAESWKDGKRTQAQLDLLKRFHYSEAELANVSKLRASEMIEAIKANGWKRPVSVAPPMPPPRLSRNGATEEWKVKNYPFDPDEVPF